MESLKIGIIAPPWLPTPPVGYGGTELMIDALARGLAASGHDVRLWATTDSTCAVTRAASRHSAGPGAPGSVQIEIAHALAGYEWLTEQRVDVIHDHTVSGPLVAPRPAVPVVTTNHGPFADPELRALYRRVGRAAAIVAISGDQAKDADGIAIAAVIPHGIDVPAIPIGRGRGDHDGPYVAFLGRMCADKGVHVAIDAAEAAGVRLLIAAKMREDAEFEYFAREVEPRLGGLITFVGELTATAKYEFLGKAMAVLNPIQWPEPFGLVMIESLACGTPVIVFDNGSAAEIVDHGVTGALCRDVDEMTRAIPGAAALDRSRCRVAALERFSTTRMVADHLALYRRLLGVTRAARRPERGVHLLEATVPEV